MRSTKRILAALQSCFIANTVEQNNVASFLKTKQKMEQKLIKQIVRAYEKEE